MKKNLAGIFPPITTPFTPEGELMIAPFRTNCERWADFALAGLTVLGSNGESPFLSDAEKLLLVKAARPLIASDKTLIVGAGRESTKLCMEFISKIAELGADYALVGTPCYFKPRMNDDSLFAHFCNVADHAPIPLIVYNVPQFTGISLSPGLVVKLSAHENIAGIKDSSGNIAFQGELKRLVPETFKILVGSAPTLLASLIQGACGGIVAIACALPALTVELYRAYSRGDWMNAAALQERLSPPAAAVTTGFGVPGLKAAMDLTGFFGGSPRLPLLPLKEEQRRTLAEVFEKAGVLSALAARVAP
jgi:4-hydroxy-2-oxoglutarate aldolase